MKQTQEFASPFFPANLNLQARKCLVVGGGRVAERKVKSLLLCGAETWVVSPELTGELEKLVELGKINSISRPYAAEDLDGCFLVISAADDRKVNSRVSEDCFARNIPVNVVDDPAKCSFTVPSVLRRGSLCIAVSTAGKSPLLARKIREELEALFGPEYAEFLELMGELRSRVIREIPDEKTRRRIFECLINSDILKLIRKSREQRAESVGQDGEDSPNSEPYVLRDLIEEQIAQCMSS
jgi:precorrin-2 dehydrogenase/sirohydrochlorin ferrochelatase